MKTHAYADLFPMMTDAEIKSLATDIKENGLKNKITVFEDKILDGRNRFEACKIAKVEPAFNTYGGKDALGFVLSLNLHRRHLTESQRAMVAAKMANMGEGRPSANSANLHSLQDSAERLNVSRRIVADAKKILQERPKEAGEIERGEKSVNEVHQLIKQHQKEMRIKQEGADRKKKIADIDIRHGDFSKVLDDVKSIDAIITDPPYPKEFIECFSSLSKYASTHLKDGGWLVVYSGQYNLPEVIKRLSEHMTYVWTFCLYHEGKKQLVNGVNIMCGWKPVLVFSKGNKKMRFSAYDVVVSEAMEKHSHEWQQSESGVFKLIEIFTKPGELVVDPFSGSGTFVKVAVENGRRGIGSEIKK